MGRQCRKNPLHSGSGKAGPWRSPLELGCLKLRLPTNDKVQVCTLDYGAVMQRLPCPKCWFTSQAGSLYKRLSSFTNQVKVGLHRMLGRMPHPTIGFRNSSKSKQVTGLTVIISLEKGLGSIGVCEPKELFNNPFLRTLHSLESITPRLLSSTNNRKLFNYRYRTGKMAIWRH